jgi:hypothetical protein
MLASQGMLVPMSAWELRPARDGRGTRPAKHRFSSTVQFSDKVSRMVEIQTP